MKVLQLNRKDDPFLLVTISFTIIIWIETVLNESLAHKDKTYSTAGLLRTFSLCGFGDKKKRNITIFKARLAFLWIYAIGDKKHFCDVLCVREKSYILFPRLDKPKPSLDISIILKSLCVFWMVEIFHNSHAVSQLWKVIWIFSSLLNDCHCGNQW